jgi:predicted DNA-binding protein with PD1-like motif
VRTLEAERLPFLGVAAGNPVNAIVAEAVPGQPIHQQVIALAEAHQLAFAGVRAAGRFSPVSISVAHNLLKTGTPLTDPDADKGPYQLFFTQQGPVEWDLSGFYAAARSLQSLVSVPGAPVHLHGAQLDRSIAGHVGLALVEAAEIRLYPLPAPVVRDADLVITNAQTAGRAVSFNVANAGSNTVTHVTVQGLAGETVAFQVQLENLAADQPRPVMLTVDPAVNTQTLRIVVDPFNDVLESIEENNTIQCPCPPPN